MNVKVRLLLFWVGADDVGGGYIAKGSLQSDRSSTVTELVIGSDPAKAPRKINHWGAAVEMRRAAESSFLGFMKSSKASSAKEAEVETSTQKTYPFEAAISYGNHSEAVSRLVPMNSPRDFTFRDFHTAQAEIIKALTQSRTTVRRLAAERKGCSKAEGFLSVVDRLSRDVVEGKSVPLTGCYVHNARFYTISLKKQTPTASKKVKFKLRNGTMFERVFKDLTLAEFEILNTESEERTNFDLLLGTSGSLRGVPIQIRYQPNWWFQVVLTVNADQES